MKALINERKRKSENSITGLGEQNQWIQFLPETEKKMIINSCSFKVT